MCALLACLLPETFRWARGELFGDGPLAAGNGTEAHWSVLDGRCGRRVWNDSEGLEPARRASDHAGVARPGRWGALAQGTRPAMMRAGPARGARMPCAPPPGPAPASCRARRPQTSLVVDA